MIFDRIRIVLVATTHPGNIGSTARAMKTMGLHRLYLVSPKSFPDYRAHEMSAGAYDVLEHVVVKESLLEALEGCELVFATSARPRDIALPGLLPSECARHVAETQGKTEVAIVFGREHAGLTNDELLLSHYHVYIPSNPDFSSLNLSQAVQIIAYELRMKIMEPKIEVDLHQEKRASIEEVERFYMHLQEVLIEIDFLKLSNPKKLMHRLRRMFNRIQLEQIDINILRGILSNIQRMVLKRD